jgi:hypothetical protein
MTAGRNVKFFLKNLDRHCKQANARRRLFLYCIRFDQIYITESIKLLDTQ